LEEAAMGFGFAATASEHARRRSQQRGIASNAIDLVLEYFDKTLYAGDGCDSLRLSHDRLAELRNSGIDQQLIDRAARIVVVMRDDNSRIVTVMHDIGVDHRYRRQCETRKRSVR